jgi:hypothetical protein
MIMDMNNLTRISLAWELFNQGVPITHITKHVDRHRETVGLWIQGIKQLGLVGFLHNYQQAKAGPRLKRRIDPAIKRLVWQIREDEHDCCGQKIAYFLAKDHDLSVSVPTIYQVLKEKYQIRSRWQKNQVRGPVPTASQPRQVIQMDTIDFGDVYAFTGIDIFSKESDVLLAPELTSNYGEKFLDQAMTRRFNGFSQLIQVDGGPEFKDRFKHKVQAYCSRFRVARPYRKNEQSYIESFNRTVRKECLGWIKYQPAQLKDCQGMVESFLERYHYRRPHMSLNMQPPLTKKE